MRPVRASRRAWLATERQQTRMLRKLLRKEEEAPEAPARIHSPFNLIGTLQCGAGVWPSLEGLPYFMDKEIVPPE